MYLVFNLLSLDVNSNQSDRWTQVVLRTTGVLFLKHIFFKVLVKALWKASDMPVLDDRVL